MMTGSFLPHHYVIQKCYELKDWLKGDENMLWSEPPSHKSVCIYPKDRVTQLANHGIVSVPPMVDFPGVLWMGSCVQNGLNSARDICNDITR